MRAFFLQQSPIKFYFRQSSDNFKVRENPLYDFSGVGEHLILLIRKVDLTTWDMLNIISKHLGIKSKEIGYAGLKDKNAFCTQYISVHKSLEPKLENFTHDNIKILQRTYHNNKLKRGHLKSNSFFIRLKKVDTMNAKRLVDSLELLNEKGFPNFYGYQRFGKSGDNYKLGKEILSKTKQFRDRKKKEFLINAYQSHLFNKWLSNRVQLSHKLNEFKFNDISNIVEVNEDDVLDNQTHFFKILKGDICSFYGTKSLFTANSYDDVSRFNAKEITITGPLYGSKYMTSTLGAKVYEDKFSDSLLDSISGSRRDAWVYMQNLVYNYKSEKEWFELSFVLPKGSYATTILEELYKRELNE